MFKPKTIEDARNAANDARREYHDAKSKMIEADRVFTRMLDEWSKANYRSPMTSKPSLSPNG